MVRDKGLKQARIAFRIRCASFNIFAVAFRFLNATSVLGLLALNEDIDPLGKPSKTRNTTNLLAYLKTCRCRPAKV
jgi:hypothetical protein